MRLLPVDTAVTVFVNATALIDDTDFKTREESVVYNQPGLDLVWNFETAAGVITQTAVTPTDTAGVYDWTNVGNGIYKIEIPASGGGTINNDTEGYGFFSGFATGILPWTGPTYAFVPAHVVNGLVAGTDNLEVNTVQAAGTAWGSGAITAASIAADAITDAKVASDVTIASVTGAVGSVTGGINTGAGIITTLDGLDTAQDTQHAQTQSDIAGLNDPTVGAIADGVWDEVLNLGSHNVGNSAGRRLRNIQDFGIYDLAAVWVDEAAGTSTGTTAGEDATVTNRSDDFDNAQTVAAAVGLTKIHITNGNSITLTATINNFVLGEPGGNWTLALGGQDVSNCDINDASVSGIAAGTNTHYHNCTMSSTTITPGSKLYNPLWVGTLTLSAAGDFQIIDPRSGVAGAAAPVLDMASVVGATTLSIRGHKGGLTVNNLTSDHTITIGGEELGTITLNGADAAVEIRGVYKALANNLTGSPTVNIDGAIKGADVAAVLVDTNELQTDWADGGRLDLIVDAILADSNELQTDDLPGLIAALNDPTAAAIASAVWATVCESQGSYTAQQILSIILSICAGVTGTNGSVFSSPDGVSTRVSATINASQERTAMTLTPSS